MNTPLKNFFRHERDQVFVPSPGFSRRVVARLANNAEYPRRESVIWEFVPNAAWPVFALALIVFVCFSAVQMFVPQPPERGMVEAYLDPDQGPGERLLYSEAELPAAQELFVEIMELGEQ